jgi:hypothetical protein
MGETLASSLIFMGGLVTAIASAAGWIPVYRMARAQRSLRVEPARRRVAIAAELFWLMAAAAVAAFGLSVIVVAGVLGFGWPAWSLLLPFGLLVGCAVLGVWARANSQHAS